MNEKITLPSLVALLSAKTGKTKKQCEDFLREFFNTLVDTLTEGENVRVKGLGTFKVIPVEPRKSVNVNTGEQMEIPGHNKIVFVPAKELAEEVNTPFAMFDSVELPDDIPDVEEEEEENVVKTNNEVKIDRNEESFKVLTPEPDYNSTEEIRVETPEEKEPEKEEPETEKIVEEERKYEWEDIDEIKQDKIEEEQEEEEEEIEQLVEEVEKVEESRKNYRFILGFVCGAACAALICLCAYLFFFEKWSDIFTSEKTTSAVPEQIEESKENPLSAKTIAESDSIAKVIAADNTASVTKEESKQDTENIAPTQPSDKKVYDTISKTRYLTTMAKEHYGNFNLWPYIYEENKAILGHPDRIRPGTKVVIPPLSKYGVDPKNPEDIRKAKNKGVEIYARYQ